MIDVRKRAEARAATENKPIGASLETERQREKQAVFRQVENLDGSNIHKIAATVLPPEGDANRPLRVAAYCRVSTDDIDQALSIAMQIKAYKEKIMATPNWKYVGTYVDDGFSGTSTEHRHGFQKLMQDCMDGKIDMVITKAVSRFARNLLDCINWVEKLQNLDPPVRIFFEQESLDTMAQTSGIILFVLAMVAEEESHMKSEAMLLSLEWRFSHGRFLTPRMFGYDKVEVPDGYGGHKKILQINPAESRVVEWMYSALLSGMSVREIADTLTELAIPTGGRRKDGIYNTHWTDSRVISILRNEKHCGDVLARKTYTKSFKDHKARKNTGQKNKYYQAGHHDAIVTRTVWNAAQRILNSHRYGHDGVYLPMHIVDSGPLTGYISLNRSWGGFEPDDYYRVSQIAMGLIDGKLAADLEKEYLPEAGKRMRGPMDDHGIAQIARQLTTAEQEMKDELEGKRKDEEASRKRTEVVKTFQVISGDMFSRVHDPVVRISPRNLIFNKNCSGKLRYAHQNPCETAEILFNPVERMLVVRPCEKDFANAYPWDGENHSARSICKLLYETLGWEEDYSYRIPCQQIDGPHGATVLFFDLDNYIGRAINKTEEVIIARKLAEEKAEGTSYYYPPDDDEPQEIKDMEERFQQVIETNKKIFGVPAFEHSTNIRGFENKGSIESDEWDMMTPARALDIDHRVDEEIVSSLLDQVRENPPTIPMETDHNILKATVVKDDTQR